MINNRIAFERAILSTYIFLGEEKHEELEKLDLRLFSDSRTSIAEAVNRLIVENLPINERYIMYYLKDRFPYQEFLEVISIYPLSSYKKDLKVLENIVKTETATKSLRW